MRHWPVWDADELLAGDPQWFRDQEGGLDPHPALRTAAEYEAAKCVVANMLGILVERLGLLGSVDWVAGQSHFLPTCPLEDPTTFRHHATARVAGIAWQRSAGVTASAAWWPDIDGAMMLTAAVSLGNGGHPTTDQLLDDALGAADAALRPQRVADHVRQLADHLLQSPTWELHDPFLALGHSPSPAQ